MAEEALVKKAAQRLLKDVNPEHRLAPSSMLADDVRLVAGSVLNRSSLIDQLHALLDEMHEEGGRINHSDYHVLSGLVDQLEPRFAEEKENPMATRVLIEIDENKINPCDVRLDRSGAVVERATDRSVGAWEYATAKVGS